MTTSETNWHAFKFISKEQFESVKYADNIEEETKQVIVAHRANVLKGFDKAQGWMGNSEGGHISVWPLPQPGRTKSD